ncbi:hypothetical protein [Megalodesulfovibrio paquesii]
MYLDNMLNNKMIFIWTTFGTTPAIPRSPSKLLLLPKPAPGMATHGAGFDLFGHADMPSRDGGQGGYQKLKPRPAAPGAGFNDFYLLAVWQGLRRDGNFDNSLK